MEPAARPAKLGAVGVGGVLEEPQPPGPAQVGQRGGVGAHEPADVDDHHSGAVVVEDGLHRGRREGEGGRVDVGEAGHAAGVDRPPPRWRRTCWPARSRCGRRAPSGPSGPARPAGRSPARPCRCSRRRRGRTWCRVAKASSSRSVLGPRVSDPVASDSSISLAMAARSSTGNVGRAGGTKGVSEARPGLYTAGPLRACGGPLGRCGHFWRSISAAFRQMHAGSRFWGGRAPLRWAGMSEPVVKTTAGAVRGAVPRAVRGVQGRAVRRADRRGAALPAAGAAGAVGRRARRHGGGERLPAAGLRRGRAGGRPAGRAVRRAGGRRSSTPRARTA